ncbi:MAG: CocE/NonD family hydrolase [Alphaproteobacteria bacterium]|nr:CocE/NonD family hydrolase [Alphaproteobacteria bacterium]
MAVVRNFPRTVKETENLWITLSDGCRVAARTWMPEDAEARPVPAILEFLPYRKRDGTAVRDELTHPYFAGYGYACLRVDMRGNGESDGLMADEYAAQEQEDCLELIEWIAAQPWCSGTVGMIGISWGGFNGLQVAWHQPEPLKAVITICSTDDRYSDDIHYKGGCILNENLGWAATMLSYSSRPADPALVGEEWRGNWLNRLENNPLLALTWLGHPWRDDYWKHGSICEDFSRIKAAVLAVGGWGDAYSNTVPRLVNGLSSPVKGIIGPWAHKYPHFAIPEPRIGFLQEALRWWDHWLKGEETGVTDDPAMRSYIQDSLPPKTMYEERPGRWVEDDGWPGSNAAVRTYNLGPGVLSETATEDAKLEISSPVTTGRDGGEYCAIWLGPDFPGDQASDDDGSLCFDTEPAGEAMDVFGAPAVELELSSDKPVGQVIVRLNDVSPAGDVARITYGALNLCHRGSHETPEPLAPGKVYRIRVQLDDIAWRLPAGHALRLAVSTCYWPLIWPAPEQATLTVHTQGSTFYLPVRADLNDATQPFQPPESAQPLALGNLREGKNVREWSTQGSVHTLSIVDDFGEDKDLTHGLISGSVGRETYTISDADPLSARATTHWTQTLSREDGWSVRIETFQEMWADGSHFHINARIEAYEGDELVFEKAWTDETVPRRLN